MTNNGGTQYDAPANSADRLLQDGMAFEQQGRLDEALEHYEAAARQAPDLARAHFYRGNLLLDRGHAQQALEAYAKAIAFKPGSAGTHYNIGNAKRALGRQEEAVLAYRKAIALKPDFSDAYAALGDVLKDLGCKEEALSSYRNAVEVTPEHAGAHFDLAFALYEWGRLEESAASFRRALEIQPDMLDVLGCLGVVLIGLKQFGAAADCFRKALDIQPRSAQAHNNLGSALKDLGQIEDALLSFRQALEIQPDLLEAHSNLLLTHNFLAGQSDTALLEEARRFGALVAQSARPSNNWSCQPEPGRCLRVGLVSADLRAHPVGYFLENVLAALADQGAQRLVFFAYSGSPVQDEVTDRIKTHCHSWHAVHEMSDEMLDQRIRQDGIDILIDLSGHTGDNRLPLFAWKPAPIQVSWLGYFATTGVAAMDYLIADPWTLPLSEAGNFTETIWRLPQTRLCFTPPAVALEVSPLPALSNGYVTFGCFNNLAKMDDAVVALWAQILIRVPTSRLFLMAAQLADASTRQQVARRFGMHGIAADRLILQRAVPRAQYLAAYQYVDIALDPFPYTGGATTAEALWMGVPVLTLEGKSFLSRQGVGLVVNAGLPDWVATDSSDYLARATQHASDLRRLAELRRGLRQQVLASPIFDAPRFAHHFEDALRAMWHKWCETR